MQTVAQASGILFAVARDPGAPPRQKKKFFFSELCYLYFSWEQLQEDRHNLTLIFTILNPYPFFIDKESKLWGKSSIHPSIYWDRVSLQAGLKPTV